MHPNDHLRVCGNLEGEVEGEGLEFGPDFSAQTLDLSFLGPLDFPDFTSLFISNCQAYVMSDM